MTRHNHEHKSKTKMKPSPINVSLGTTIIHSLVSNSQTREEDRVAINAMKESVWFYMNSAYTQNDKIHWAAAGMLAAYNLGRWGVKIPTGKEQETKTP